MTLVQVLTNTGSYNQDFKRYLLCCPAHPTTTPPSVCTHVEVGCCCCGEPKDRRECCGQAKADLAAVCVTDHAPHWCANTHACKHHAAEP